MKFYLGNVNGTALGTGTVSPINGKATATFEVTLNGDDWKPNGTAYTITADFGGYTDGKLLDSVGTGTLTVSKKSGDPAPSTRFSFDGNNSNKLTDTTTAMEYSLDSGTNWIDCSETSTDLTAVLANIKSDNDIKVRVKETDTQLVGKTRIIDITPSLAGCLRPPRTSLFTA